jgi:hypothetical protein
LSNGTRPGRDARSAGARPNSEQESRSNRQRRGECQHAPVDRERERDRQRARWGRRRLEGTHREPRECESEGAAGRREHDAFCKELPHQPPPAGADREPHRHLAPARARPRQQQVGDVGARDRQHRADDPEEQPRHRDQLRPLSRHVVVDPPQHEAVLRRVRDAQAIGRRRDRHVGRLGLRFRDARLQTRDGEEPTVAADLQQIGIHLAGVARARRPHHRLHRHRHVDIPRRSELRTGKVRGRDADDRERLTVQQDRVAEDVAAAAEATLPEAMTDHRHGMRPRRHVVGPRQRAAHRRGDAQELEEVAGDDDARHEIGEAVGVETGGEWSPRRQLVGDAVGCRDLAKQRV